MIPKSYPIVPSLRKSATSHHRVIDETIDAGHELRLFDWVVGLEEARQRMRTVREGNQLHVRTDLTRMFDEVERLSERDDRVFLSVQDEDGRGIVIEMRDRRALHHQFTPRLAAALIKLQMREPRLDELEQ